MYYYKTCYGTVDYFQGGLVVWKTNIFVLTISEIFIPFLSTIIRIQVDDNNSFSVLKPVRLYQTLYIEKQLFADLSIHKPIEFIGLVFMYDNIILFAFTTPANKRQIFYSLLVSKRFSCTFCKIVSTKINLLLHDILLYYLICEQPMFSHVSRGPPILYWQPKIYCKI